MPSGFDHFFDDNIFEICIKNNFSNINCIFGSIEFISSFVILALTILGLIKMIKYYDKFNFEMCLLLFSIFQILLMDMIIITPHDFLFELFFVTQLFLVSLIIWKFLKIIKSNKLRENIIIFLINIINILIFIFFVLSLFELFLADIYLYIRFTSRIFYFLTTVNLAILCRALIKKLDKYETKNETFDLFLRKYNTKNSVKSEHFVFSFYSQELFFMVRKKQITPLYIVNLLCSFIQMIFIFLKSFILTDIFSKKDNKIVSTDEGYIIYYIYLLSYFLNIMINFICFYWMIREQYNQSDIKINKKKDNKILDEDFIIRESIQSSKEVTKNIFTEKNDDKNRKLKKSLYSSTFSDLDDKDNQENYFVKKDEKKFEDIKEESIEYEFDNSKNNIMLSDDAINNSNYKK
jgi:hypothetical protein